METLLWTINDVHTIYSAACAGEQEHKELEMWANAQSDGRPAEYRWRPLFNAAKFGWRPIVECRAVTLPRRETCWNLQGCPKLTKRSQPLVGRSSAHCQDIWGDIAVWHFFPIVDMCLSCEHIARRSCAMVPRRPIFGDFFLSCISSEPRAAHFRPVFQIRTKATPCVEVYHKIRRGKKEDRRKKERNHRTKI